MRDGERITVSILLTCGCLTLILAIIAITVAPILTISVIGVAKVKGEGVIYDWYNGPFAEWLGLGCATGFRLSSQDIHKISKLGIPIDAVSSAEDGRRRCGNDFGANIDIGIILAIMDMESDYGANMGSTDWKKGINSNSNINQGAEISAGEWLLDYWQEQDLRAKSSEAASHIYPDYSGYEGHSSASEMGDGFLPSSAKRACEQALANSGDPELASCNFFTREVNGYAISWYLYREGYSADQSTSQKIDSLYGWNHSLGTRTSLVARATAINAVIGAINVYADVKGVILEPGKTLIGDMKLAIIRVLDSIDLLPDRIGWLEMPLREEDLSEHFPDGISNDYMEKTYDKNGHPGIDFVCRAAGVDVIAVANGVIIEPDPGTLMGVLSVTRKDSNFGNNVWIDHGGSLYAIYAHLLTVDVEVGDEVVQGQVIGTCGSTGNSTGPHVHFQVLNIHPNEMVFYRQEDPGNINPHDVLGTCLILDEEEETDETEGEE